MSDAADQLVCVAQAEKQLIEQMGPLLARILQDIENRLDIKIGEARMTVNRSDATQTWGAINCVITQADFPSDGRAQSRPLPMATMGGGACPSD